MIKVANNIQHMLRKQALSAPQVGFNIARPSPTQPPIASYGNTPATSMDPALVQELLSRNQLGNDMDFFASTRPEDLAAAYNTQAALQPVSSMPKNQERLYNNEARKMHNMFRASNMARGVFDPRYAKRINGPLPRR